MAKAQQIQLDSYQMYVTSVEVNDGVSLYL